MNAGKNLAIEHGYVALMVLDHHGPKLLQFSLHRHSYRVEKHDLPNLQFAYERHRTVQHALVALGQNTDHLAKSDYAHQVWAVHHHNRTKVFIGHRDDALRKQAVWLYGVQRCTL